MSARWAWRRLATGLLAVLLSPVLAAFLTLPGAQADNPPPIPTVSFSNMSSPLIGQSVTFDVSFVNTGTVTGYGPYVDLQLPRGHDLDDGLTFTSATYLGSTITPVLLTADAGGCVYHPYAVDKTGSPVHVCGLVAGQSYVVLRLPFGSFTPGQPAAVVHVTTALSNKANAGYALTIGADGGFQFGATAVNDPSTDPSTLGTGITTTVTPTVMRITKTYNGPEDETATGPNYRRSYTIDVTVAPGQTVQNLTVSDVLPNTIQYVAVVSTSPTPVSVTPPAAPGPGGTLSVNFGQVTGTGGTDAALTFSFYVPRVDSGSAAILDPATGAFDTSVDNAGASGSWTPIDTRDGGPTTVTAGPATHTLTDKSIAVQKSVSLVTDTTPPGVSPGDTLQWTISVQVSDYFALNNVIVDDLLGDGTRVDGSFTPTLAVTGAVDSSGARSPLTAVGMASGHAVVSAVNGSGQTPIRFRLSDELVTRGELDRLVGGCVNPVTGSSTPDCSAHNDGPTTATIVFRSIVQQTYISGAEVVEGDTLVNEAAATGTVLNTGSFASTGNTIGDGSANVATAGTSASISIDRGSLQKSIYAVNGVAVGSQTGIHVSPGSQLTYRLEQTFPTSRTDDFVMTDYLPLPVFYAAGVTTFDDASKAAPGTIPAAGHANYGPSDTFHSLISDDGVHTPIPAPTPAVTSQVGANSVTFTYGDFALFHPAASVADILFTVTVSTDPFADGLLLTNQARSQTKNAVGTIETADAIVQITLDQPVVTVTKGVVGTDNTAGTFTPATKGPAGVAFTSPTGVSSVGCPGFTGGPITSAGLTANPIDSNLSHVDAGDYVRFAITLQNTGHANAFGVSFHDTLPAGFAVPSGSGLDLCVANGAGTALATTDLGGGLFGSGLELVDDPTNGSLAAGASSAGVANSAGTNVAVISYTLQLTGAVVPSSVITNTASLDDFTNAEGTAPHLTTSLTDTATVTIAPPAAAKAMTGRSLNTGANTNVAIGEIVTYQLTLTIPEGTLPGAQVVDTLPAGMAFKKCDSITNSNPGQVATTLGTDFSSACNAGLSSPNDPIVSGQLVTFGLGTITNSNTVNATAETITIQYETVIVNDANTNRGTLLHNSAVLSWTGGTIAAVTTPNLTVVEPLMTVTKSAVNADVPARGATGDAFDTITYTVIISNDNNANGTTAYDVSLSDVVPTGMTYVAAPPGSAWRQTAGTATATSVTAVGSTLSATWDSFPKNSSATFQFSATIDATATPSEVFANTANATYTSLPGLVTTTQSAFSDVATERTGSTSDPGGNNNDYRASGSRNVTVTAGAMTKSIKTTNLADTTGSNVAIGEIVTYELVITIPEGTMPAAKVTDTLPAGLAFKQCDSIVNSNPTQVTTTLGADFSSACNAGASSPNDPIVANNGKLVTYDLGTITNANNDNGTAETIKIDYDAVVLNVVTNTRGTLLHNTAVLSWTGHSASVSASNLTVVEPIMTVNKTAVNADYPADGTSGDAGDTFTFTVTVANPHATNEAIAYEAAWSDTIPTGLTYVDSSLQYVVGSCDTQPDTGSLAATDGTLAATWKTFGPGSSCVLQYQAKLDDNVPSGSSYTNNAVVTWTSLPNDMRTPQSGYNGVSTERTGSTGDPGNTANTYIAQKGVTVNVPQPAPVKTLVSTSEPGTSGSSVAIGEIARLRVSVVIPEGITPNVTLVDAIPTGLSFLNDGTAKVAFVTDGTVDPAGNMSSTTIPAGDGLAVSGDATWAGNPTYAIPSGDITGGPFGDGTDPTFNLGTLTNADRDPDSEAVVIEFNVLVDNVASNDTPGTSLADTISIYKSGTQLATSDPLAVTVSHPSVTLAKAITTTPHDGGDTIVYKLTIQNSSGANVSPAYDLRVQDTLDASLGIADISDISIAGPGTWHNNSNPATRTVDVTFDALAPGAAANTVTITATVAPDVAAGKTIPNTAHAAWTSLPGDNGTPVGVDNTTGSANTGTPGAATGERTGSGVSPNDYLTSSAANTTLNAPSISKLGPAPATATIGGTTTFDLVVTLPEGTTSNLAVIDTLPAGLTPVSSTVVTDKADSNGRLTADFSGGTLTKSGESEPPGSAGGAWTVSFGTSTVVPADGDTTDDSFLLQMTVLVANVQGNQSGDKLINHAAVQYTNPDSGSQTVAAPQAPYVTVIEPVLQVSKTADVAKPRFKGNVEYTLTISHATASNADAFTVNLTDTLPTGLTYVSGSLHNTAGLAPSGTPTVVGQTITITFDSFPLGSTSTFKYDATVADSPAVHIGDALTNSVGATWTSLASTDPNVSSERTGADGPGKLNDYVATTSAPVTVGGVDLTLTKDDGRTTATAGATLTYALAYTNAGNQGATGVKITETVPTGTTYTGSGWTCVDSHGATSSAAGSTCTLTIGSVAANGSGSVNFAVTVVDPVPPSLKEISNTAAIADDGTANADPTPDNNTATDVDTIPEADLSLTKTVAGIHTATPNANDVLVFTLTVTNAGPDQATNVQVKDLLPSQLTYVTSSPSGVYVNSTGIWTVGSIDVGKSATLTISAKATSYQPSVNSAEITHSDQRDNNSTPNNHVTTEDDYDSVAVTPNISDLAITKTVDVANPDPGTDVTYTIVATNNGPVDATDVKVTDTWPSGMTYESCTPTGAYDSTSGVWTIGPLANGHSATLTITAKVKNTGTITNTATIAGDQFDSVPGNNTASTDTSQLIDLSVKKTVDDPTPNVGSDVTFKVVVSNAGPDIANQVVIQDSLPAGLTYVSDDGAGAYDHSSGLWTVGSIAADSSATLSVQAQVDSPAAGKAPTTLTNTASVKSVQEPESDPTNDTSSVTVAPLYADLAVTKTVANPRPDKGDDDTFTVTVTNNGPDTATNVALSDVLPDGLTYKSDTESQGAFDSATGTWTVGTLANGAGATLTLTANVPDYGDYTNSASISHSDQYDPNSANNTSSASLTTRVADIGVTKTADKPAPAVGSTVTYTVTATNGGPDDATQLVIHDALPASLTYVSSTPSAGAGTYDPTKGDWTVGGLANGTSATLQITARVVRSGQIDNTASVSGLLQKDPNDENDQATATIQVPPAADLALTKTVDNSKPDKGANVTFTVTLTNHGPNATTGVHVADLLPAGLTFVSDTPSVGTYDPTSGDWAVGGMAVGEVQTLAVTATVALEGPIVNTAEVTASDLPDPNSTPNNHDPSENDQASVTVNPHGVADLALTKTVSPTTVRLGDQATYTLVVTDKGPDAASGVIVRDQLPAGVSFVSSSDSNYDPTTGAWTVGSLGSGSSASLTITVRVGQAGSIVNTAEVAALDQRDPVPADGEAVAGISAAGATPPTTVTHDADPGPPAPGFLALWVLGIAFAGFTLIALGGLGARNRGLKRRM